MNNVIKNSTFLRLRTAARAYGLWLSVNTENCDTDEVTLEIATEDADRDFITAIEKRTSERFAAFFASCNADQQRWLNGEFRLTKSRYHRDRRYVSGVMLKVRG